MVQDYTTLRVTEDAKAKAEESKRDDETWNEFILRCTENAPERREFVAADEVDGLDVSDIREALATIEHRTGRIERAVEEMNGR